ncbi:hypothetical protein ACFX2I_002946 [Malus domestica]
MSGSSRAFGLDLEETVMNRSSRAFGLDLEETVMNRSSKGFRLNLEERLDVCGFVDIVDPKGRWGLILDER